ncbi:MAG: twin-arginine translocase TatA/TatE family subunit [Gammaproteobacteria bacterium]|nr:twin-arginine translocase TatA/TatE family subunit [Gammaproteobacteria bacterium]
MGFGVTELLIILAIVLVLFGAKKLRNIGGDLGGAIKNFKGAMKEEENASDSDSTSTDSDSTSTAQQSQAKMNALDEKSGTTIEGTVEDTVNSKNKEQV